MPPAPRTELRCVDLCSFAHEHTCTHARTRTRTQTRLHAACIAAHTRKASGSLGYCWGMRAEFESRFTICPLCLTILGASVPAFLACTVPRPSGFEAVAWSRRRQRRQRPSLRLSFNGVDKRCQCNRSSSRGGRAVDDGDEDPPYAASRPT